MVPASVPGGPGRGAVPVAAGGGGSRLRQRGRSGARLRVEPLHQPRPHRLDPPPAGGRVGVPLVPDPFRHSGHRFHRVRAVGRARSHRPCRPEPAGRVDHVMPREMGADGDPSVAGLLEALAADDHPGLRFEEQEWSWRQVVSAGAVRASLLRSMGGAGPPHVGILLGNVPEYLFLLLFTSGTTGTPKAVRCTQGRLASIGMRSAEAYGFERDDVAYCTMPLFHGNALMALWAPSLVVGATVALARRFSASGFLGDVHRHGATTFTYVCLLY